MEVPRMLRPLGLMEIIDQTFRMYRANFKLFFGIAAIAYVPAAIVQAIIQGLAASPTAIESTAAIVAMIVGVLTLIPIYLAVFLSNGAVTKAISDRYLGDQITIGESYRFIFQRFWPFLLTAIVSGLFVLSGIVLCGVGMIVFIFWTAFVTQIFVLEDKRYFDAIWRSKFLIGQGVWAQVLVLGIVIGLITLIIQLPFEAMAQAPAMLGGQPNVILTLIGTFLSGVVSALVLPLGQISTTMLYYDSRIRKEGFDLQVLAQEMGKALPPVVTPQPIISETPTISETPIISETPQTPTETAPPTEESNT